MMKSNKTLQTEKIRLYIESCLNIDITKRTRKRNYVYARTIYFKLCREYTKLSLSDIGETMNMDHASVVHAIGNVFPVVILYDKYLCDLYNEYKFSNKHNAETIFENYSRLLRENLELRTEVKYIKETELRNALNNKKLDRRFVDLYEGIPIEKRNEVYNKLDTIVKVTRAFYERDTV